MKAFPIYHALYLSCAPFGEGFHVEYQRVRWSAHTYRDFVWIRRPRRPGQRV